MQYFFHPKDFDQPDRQSTCDQRRLLFHQNEENKILDEAELHQKNKPQLIPSYAFILAVFHLMFLQIRERNMDYFWRFGLMPLCWFFMRTLIHLSILHLQLGRIFGKPAPILNYHWGRYEHFGFFKVKQDVAHGEHRAKIVVRINKL